MRHNSFCGVCGNFFNYWKCVCVCVCVCAYVHVRMCVCVCTCAVVCICVHIFISIFCLFPEIIFPGFNDAHDTVSVSDAIYSNIISQDQVS